MNHTALQAIPSFRARPTPLRVMAILNTTPDSFWAGSRFKTAQHAIAAGRRMLDTGAWAVDVGGESTRPGAAPISIEQELDRVLPVIRSLAHLGTISIDTRNPEVAEQAVQAGAVIINDVSGKLHHLAGRLGVGYVSMHSLAVPVLPNVYPTYQDVVTDVAAAVTEIAQSANMSGAGPVWIDPGIGFGKTAHDNIELLRALPALCDNDFPVLLGASRKSFIGDITGRDTTDRLAGSLAIIAPAWSAGVDVIRVHDLPETLDTIAMLNTVWGCRKTRSRRGP